MGFWSSFGKGLLGIGSAIAAPFTGGASLAIPGILGAMGGGNKGAWSEAYPGNPSGAQGGGMFGGFGGFGGMGGYGAGMGLNTLGAFLNAQAQNRVKMVPLPPPNALFPGINQQFTQGMGTFGPQSFDTLTQMSKTGMPVDYTDLFNTFVGANQRTVDQGRAALMEKYGSSGLRYGSAMAQGATDYETQVAKDKMNILAQLMMSSNEAARSRQMQASGMGAGMFQQTGSAFTPSAMPLVGGTSPWGTAMSGAGNAMQTFSLLRMMGII